MQSPVLDNNRVYQGMVDWTPGDVPGSFDAPKGVLVTLLDMPPTDEPGKWRDNGSAWVAVSLEELQAAEHAAAKAEASVILAARMQEQLARTEVFSASEFTLFAKAGLFPEWAPGTAYAQGERFVHEGVVYETQQAVTAQAHQTPGSAGMLAVYRPLSVDGGTGEEPDGSREHPYTFIYGMDVAGGKYYTFEGFLYLAKADMMPCVWAPGTPGLWQWEPAG